MVVPQHLTLSPRLLLPNLLRPLLRLLKGPFGLMVNLLLVAEPAVGLGKSAVL